MPSAMSEALSGCFSWPCAPVIATATAAPERKRSHIECLRVLVMNAVYISHELHGRLPSDGSDGTRTIAALPTGLGPQVSLLFEHFGAADDRSIISKRTPSRSSVTEFANRFPLAKLWLKVAAPALPHPPRCTVDLVSQKPPIAPMTLTKVPAHPARAKKSCHWRAQNP